MTIDRFEFVVNNILVRSENVHAVWFRKGAFWFKDFFQSINISQINALSLEVEKMLKMEEMRIKYFFHQHLMRSRRVLGNPIVGNPNKLSFMECARSVGFKTPDFVISNLRDDLETVNKDDYVTKGISEGLYLWDREETQSGYFSYTEDFNPISLINFPSKIATSMLQKKIDKVVELRVFYLDGLIFAMAIFSQSDEQTATDFRKYNMDRPNRNVPVQLEAKVQRQLSELFAKVCLNTGSVDLILDKNGDYYFLEINPFGQYEWVSWACNYDLDQHIADWLVEH
jgi:ATP-GRASP peptide maturase of grasp-with-spasm system